MISAKEPDKAEEPRHVQVVGGDYGPSLPGMTMERPLGRQPEETEALMAADAKIGRIEMRC